MQARQRENPHRYSVYQSRYNNIAGIYKTQIASIKTLSLHHLTAKQHMLLALCRDISLIPAGFHMCKAIRKAYLISFKDIFHNKYNYTNNEIKILSNLITGRASEYMLCSMWCLVSLYLSFATLDNLMVRWIMKYSIMAVILRMFSMSLVLITIEHFLLNSLSPERDYYLHTWILISGILTGLFIWQNYLNSNMDYLNTHHHQQQQQHHDIVDDNESSHTISVEETEPNDITLKRAFNLYNIIVFCVVPLGSASFITMLCLLRNLFIQRLDIEHLIDLLAIQV
ncbi:N-glycosylation protein Eos1p [Monosporozyma servazzii]